MKPRSHGVSLLLFLIFGAGCEAVETSTESSDVARWSLGAPILTIGTRDDGPDAFSPIREVAFTREGAIYVLLPQELVVKEFDQSGGYVGSIGGPGEGPGEFSQPSSLTVLGDTLLVLDGGTRRVSVFLDGELLGTDPYPDLQGVATQRLPRLVGYVSGFRPLVAAQIGVPMQPAPGDTAFLAVISDSGPNRLANLNADHLTGFLVRREGDAIAMMRPIPQPFSDASLWSVSPTGEDVVVVDRSVDSSTATFLVTVISTVTGDTLFHVAHSYEPTLIAPAVVDSIVETLAVGGFGSDEVLEELFTPETYPPVGDVFHASDGTVWLGEVLQPGEATEWRVLTREGAVQAKLLAPPGFDVEWSDGDAVWGLVVDEFEVPHLVKRPILKN